MIIIYNLRGFLFGVAGLAVAVVFLVLTKFLTAGLVALGAFWIFFGRSPGIDPETGKKRPAGSIFFIPLFVWGILVLFLTVPAVGIDYLIATTDFKKLEEERAANADPREAMFHAEERRLETADDLPGLSQSLRAFLEESLPGASFKVAVGSKPGKLLVLIETPDLKRVKMEDRETVMEAVRDLAQAADPESEIFAGLKGKLFYGATVSPTTPTEVGSLVLKEPLYDYFGPRPPKNESAQTSAEDPAALETPPADALSVLSGQEPESDPAPTDSSKLPNETE